MDVAIVCSSRELFGADRSALRLAHVLERTGRRVTLVLPERRPEHGLRDEARRGGLEAVEARVAIATHRGIEDIRALDPWRPRLRADLVIYNSTAVLGGAACGERTLIMVREWLDPRSPRHVVLAIHHALAADAAVAVSTGALRQWSRCTVRRAPGHLLHDWLEPRPVPGPEASKSGILFLGRFNTWKGQEWLADAYTRAFPEGPRGAKPSLTFVGAQPGTVFEHQARQLAARGDAGGWSVEPFAHDTSPFFDRAALLVVPSLRPEPFGMVILEALAHGCRVLAFPGGGPDDLVTDFPGRLTLVPRSQDALAAALRRWWSAGGRPQTPEELSRTTATLVDRYSASRASERMKAIIDSLP